jgi:hypothetical protein
LRINCNQSLLRLLIWFARSEVVWVRSSLGTVATLTTSTPSGRATNFTCTRARAACSLSISGRIVVCAVRAVFNDDILSRTARVVNLSAQGAKDFFAHRMYGMVRRVGVSKVTEEQGEGGRGRDSSSTLS